MASLRWAFFHFLSLPPVSTRRTPLSAFPTSTLSWHLISWEHLLKDPEQWREAQLPRYTWACLKPPSPPWPVLMSNATYPTTDSVAGLDSITNVPQRLTPATCVQCSQFPRERPSNSTSHPSLPLAPSTEPCHLFMVRSKVKILTQTKLGPIKLD